MLLNNFLQILATVLSIRLAVTQRQTAWTSVFFPDPREDFVVCRLRAPGTICDPDGIFREQELYSLMRSIEDAEVSSRNVINQSPDCQNSPTEQNSGIQFTIVIVKKVINNRVAIQLEEFIKFAREVHALYSMWSWRHQMSSHCDKTIFIALSKEDGQLYSISGKDVQLTGPILNDAFERNRDTFTRGQFATGLMEMIALLTNAYEQMHNVVPDNFRPELLRERTTTPSAMDTPRVIFMTPMTTQRWLLLRPTTTAPPPSPKLLVIDKPPKIQKPLNDKLEANTTLSPKAQKLWQEILTATFKFFSDAFVGLVGIL